MHFANWPTWANPPPSNYLRSSILFRDTLKRMLDAGNLEFKELIASV